LIGIQLAKEQMRTNFRRQWRSFFVFRAEKEREEEEKIKRK
jgi:hypothetical protein